MAYNRPNRQKFGWATQVGDGWIVKMAPGFSPIPGQATPVTLQLAKQKIQTATSHPLRWDQVNAPFEPIIWEGYLPVLPP